MVDLLQKLTRSNGQQGGQELYLRVALVRGRPEVNSTLYSIRLEYRGNGNGGWNVRGNNWSVEAAGVQWSGSWGIPDGSGGRTTLLLESTFLVKHDAGGSAPAFDVRATISSTNTRYIGSASVAAKEAAPPRLTKKPSAPGKPTSSGVLPTSVTIAWPASTDNGGSSITGYLLRYWSNPEGSGQYTDVSFANNRSRTVTGLKPGGKYRFVVYARNGSSDNDGYSVPSEAIVVQTFAGVRIRRLGVWRKAIPYVKHNGKWKLALPFRKVQGKWKPTA